MFFDELKADTCAITGERTKNINTELWHACAGPLVTLPPVGSLVVYFPQGHSEQVHVKGVSCYLAHCFGIFGLSWLVLVSSD